MVKFSDYQRLKDAALLDRSEAKVVTVALPDFLVCILHLAFQKRDRDATIVHNIR